MPVDDDGPFFARQGIRGPGWLVVSLPMLPLAIGWLITADESLMTAGGALRSVALLLGLLGYAAFATDLVLGARIPPVERLFGGLDRMYRFHRRLGAAAGGLLIGHLVLLVAARATGVTDGGVAGLLAPDPGWRVFAGVVALSLTAAVLALSAFVRLRHEVFLRVHRLLGLGFAIGALHAFRVPAAAGRPTAITWYLGFLTAAGLVAWVYRSGLGRNLIRRHYYRVAAIRPLRHDVVEVTLDPVEDRLPFTPGQHVFIGLDDQAVGHEQHPFSITSGPHERELRLVVKAVGDYTSALVDVDEGAWATIEGPYGGFWHQGLRAKRQIWIAGGIGITPFLAMARSLDDSAAVDVDLYYGTEDAASAVYVDELHELAARHPALTVIPVPADTEGFLSAERVAVRSGDLSRAHVYLCGPPAMLDALVPQFAAAGVSHDCIHYEEFRLRGRASR